MKVLVTGATGLLGSAIARELVARGHEVSALVRPGSDLAPLAGLAVEVARGDVLDAASLSAALAGRDAVVHAAGLARIGSDPEATRAVNVRGTELVLGAALEAGVARAVHTSSTSVMGGTRAPALLDEATPGNAASLGIGYFATKLAAEHAALALAARVLAGHNLGMGEMFARTCALAGVPAPRRLPVPVALAFAGAQEVYARLAGRRPGMTRELVRAAALYTFASSARAQRELGYVIRPFEEMVADTLRFALATGRLRAERSEERR